MLINDNESDAVLVVCGAATRPGTFICSVSLQDEYERSLALRGV